MAGIEASNGLFQIDQLVALMGENPHAQAFVNVPIGNVSPICGNRGDCEYDLWMKMLISIMEPVYSQLLDSSRKGLVSHSYSAFTKEDAREYLGQVAITKLANGLFTAEGQVHIKDFLEQQELFRQNLGLTLERMLPPGFNGSKVDLIPTSYFVGQLDGASLCAGRVQSLDNLTADSLPCIGNIHANGPYVRLFPGTFDPSNLDRV